MEELKRATTKLQTPQRIPFGNLLQAIRGEKHHTRKGYKKQRLENMSCDKMKPGCTVITQKDNGKIVLRRNSFQESRSKARPVSSYNNVPISSLVSIGRDINENEVKEHEKKCIKNRCSTVDSNNNNSKELGHHGNNAVDMVTPTAKGNLCLDDEVPHFRRERRGAIAEVSKRDRKDIINALRTRCVAKSLTVTGLIETGR